MLVNLVKKIRSNEAGATAIEYGLIAALVAIAAIGGLQFLGGSLDDTFTKVHEDLDAAIQ
ncbi:MAG TPA: Flp family type IVb pilin [Sphingomonadales bacterium]